MQVAPIAKELVLIGGGHSHVIVLRMLAMNPIPGLQITLVSPDTRTPYSGMLPGLIAGHYDEDDIHIDLVPLCRFAGARFVQGRVEGVDPDSQSIQIAERPNLRYDVLSIDIGITPSLDVPGAVDSVIPVKPINEFLARWRPFVERVAAGKVSRVGFVGAGAGGVELCLAVQYRLRQEFAPHTHPIEYHLFADGDRILPEFNENVRARFQTSLAGRKVNIHHGFRVARVDDHTVTSTTDESVTLDEIFWVTSAASQSWLKNTGLELNDQGFVAVDCTLQSVNYANVFAGDETRCLELVLERSGYFFLFCQSDTQQHDEEGIVLLWP